MRPELAQIVAQLLARPERVVDLDSIGELIGVMAVSTQDIEEVVTALEVAGRTVGHQEPSASAGLAQVLQAARRLRVELGRTPTVAEIAEHEQLEQSRVHVALLFARIVQR